MTYAFHISREARERYGVDDELVTITGNVIIPDFAAGRRLAQRMNDRDGRGRDPRRAVHAGQLNAMGLLDEILHAVVAAYRQEVSPRAVALALDAAAARVGADGVERTLQAFVARFPTADAMRRDLAPAEYLAGRTDGVPNREVALEELLLLWLANANPAFGPFRELFDETPLAAAAPYRDVIAALVAHFATQPPLGPDGQTLVDLLRAPALAVPDSIAGQLRYVRERWAFILDRFGSRLVTQLDVLAEEEAAIWRLFHPGGPGGGAEDAALRASRAWLAESGWAGEGGEAEAERFSVDRDWMPRLVLIAKSSFVWLDQLSKRHGRAITRLDEIPDEELDELARRGFTGLWLIGLWQRSRASQTIKQLRGNPDAVASAYSLDDYRIADDLGGEAAFENLRSRAWARGIRIASDMVPNHMGIDSRWVMEHPDWFMGLPEPPYPAYSFTGPDLSTDPGVGIQIEDHYFDNTDAAVVFRRWDRGTGETRYLYHGNDGTSMPWNDTAQLDYLRADVREAVIQTILAVARRSPVIRFDAAMTLAKRHIERLWYPEPGSGGAIPSRAEHALPRADFEAAMPVEFWREVVDRVAAEVPDTLLLAEAFWLMEGYFVRTLGMHRVYNSAFMNMLRDEKNAEYRAVMRNTIEFDPEILKRYVNFMNNPDERTAVDQFGRGDKYFGVATLMATLPGLPMFGHGQVEGFTEKYGMEYRRAYWDEQPDSWLVDRHQREIAPLLHRRALFADVDDFLLFDFVRDDGSVDEDVFAYANRGGGERSLVVYNNRYGSTAGWVRESVAYSARTDDGGRELRRRTLGDGLGLRDEPGRYLALRDWRSGLETIHAAADVLDRGLRFDLDAYACRVFIGIRELDDAPGRPWGRLAGDLAGRAVPSLDDALRDLLLRPVQEPLRRLLRPEVLRRIARLPAPDDPTDRRDDRTGADAPAGAGAPAARPAGMAEAPDEPATPAVPAAAAPGPDAPEAAAVAAEIRGDLAALIGAGRELVGDSWRGPEDERASDVLAAAVARDLRASARAAAGPVSDGALVLSAAWLVLGRLPAVLGQAGEGIRARAWIDEWRLGPPIADAFREAGADEADAWRHVEAVKALLGLPAWDLSIPRDARVRSILAAWLANESVARVLRVNVHRDVRWFNREAFEAFAASAAAIQRLGLLAGGRAVPAPAAGEIGATQAALVAASVASGYRVDALLPVSDPEPPARTG